MLDALVTTTVWTEEQFLYILDCRQDSELELLRTHEVGVTVRRFHSSMTKNFFVDLTRRMHEVGAGRFQPFRVHTSVTKKKFWRSDSD